MDLNEKFKHFADEEYESIDTVKDSIFHGKKADYFAFDRSWILEVKFLETDRRIQLNDFINDLADNDPDLPVFFGTVSVERLIEKHKNPILIRNILCNRFARNLEALLRKADKQILETKNVIDGHNTIGVVVILNERNDFHDQKFIYQEISRLLHKVDEKGAFERENIQAVWYIHEYKENNKKQCFSTFLIGPTANFDSVKSLADLLNMDWINYNGYTFSI
ncbi:hypothetical protein M0D70_06455 [Acinetobacter portensis]|uniref:Uncharacterized protein n=2 Tax=Acinetobacter TaxID=469 RepID=A0A6L6GFZ8_9GAMM|nr:MULTISPECIES: hypothetical protein [Acinetobacter]MCK7608957.1 hypothetical protein [Acinetobacter portensis]MCK7639814.1 hypothetical protein [Acinetobacter portensis]MDY6459641.1 hypothetical protein [Acinetobacter faecalis]MDY6462528.1 hypothetical protein [Acinetobacter faecalis]MDY6485250.1 hypothetical protein [Acinetobacter faecalis]